MLTTVVVGVAFLSFIKLIVVLAWELTKLGFYLAFLTVCVMLLVLAIPFWITFLVFDEYRKSGS